MKLTDMIRMRLYDRLRIGRVDQSELPPVRYYGRDLLNTEVDHEFLHYMKLNMVQGYFRYGPLGAIGKPNFDRITDIKNRIELYCLTGNDNLLVDVANMAMIEFSEGTHPTKHMLVTDDGEIHTTIKEG